MSKEVLAFVYSHVFEKKDQVLLVSRADGDGQLPCRGAHDREVPRVVGINHLVDVDGSLRESLDLPPNWEAERTGPGKQWERWPIA